MARSRKQTPRFNAACARLAAVYVLAGGATAQSYGQDSGPITFTLATDAAGLAHQFTPVTYPAMHGVMTGAACVLDANNDGWPDLFVAGGGGVADRLFINNADGSATFTDRAADWGVDALHRAGGAAAADVNGDGLDDLFVVSMGDVADTGGPNGGGSNPFDSKLYINRGDHFEEVAVAAGLDRIATVTDGFGATFGDYDLDGDLDVFVSAWFEVDGGNRLYRNDAIGPDGVPLFSWVNPEIPLDTDRLRGFTPRFADMNGDRWPDLLLTNDFKTSRYFESLGDPGSGFQGFVDRTVDAGINADCNGMGATVGDIDNDGDLDWYVSNIFNPPPTTDTCGNVLYTNDGSGGFVNTARDLGIDDAGWGWGTAMSDLDLDGDLDILSTSGWPNFTNKPLRVYEQLASVPSSDGVQMSFREVGAASGAAFTGQGRGLVMFDADLDGDQDFYVVDNTAPSRFYRNDTAPCGSWLRVSVETDAHPCLAPSGMHAVVRARVSGTDSDRWLMRAMDGGITYLGQSEQVAHFGLGGAAVVDELVVEWSDGTDTVLTDVAVDQAITVVARHPVDLDDTPGLTIFDIIAMINRVQSGDASVDFDGDGDADLDDIIAGIGLFENPCAR